MPAGPHIGINRATRKLPWADVWPLSRKSASSIGSATSCAWRLKPIFPAAKLANLHIAIEFVFQVNYFQDENELRRMMSTEPNPFDRHLSYVLAAAHRSVSKSLTERLKKHGIQVEAWRVMECLDVGQKLTMGELAKRALINPPALSKLVDRMVSDGLVHRQISSTDQRQINLLLTNLGRARMLQIRKDAEEQDRALNDLMETQDGAYLKELLQKLT